MRIRLSRTFRGPFANLSRISRLKNAISETNVYARVAFIICVNQGATANFRTWDDTKLKPVRIHRQKKADVYISLYMDPVAILEGKLPSPSMNTITYVYK